MNRQIASQTHQESATAQLLASGILQRKCACGQHTVAGSGCSACSAEREQSLQRSAISHEAINAGSIVTPRSSAQVADVGTRAFGQDFSRVSLHASEREMLQTKLTISQPGDIYEQEADRLSAQVMNMPGRQSFSNNPLGRQPTNGQDVIAQRQEQTQESGGGNTVLNVTASFDSMLPHGQPLPASVRSFMEPRFGQDFSQVRIHTDQRASALAHEVNAHAFTVGRNIAFGKNQYAPGTSAGRHLIAHELTHVIQQANGLKSGSVASAGLGLQRQPAADIELISPQFAGNADLKEVRNRRKFLNVGSGGDAVRLVQEALLDEGYELPKFGADGKFGSETAKAVREFQTRWRLAVDGVVGDQTLGLLDAHAVGKGVLKLGEKLGPFSGLVKRIGGAVLDASEKSRAVTACPGASKAERKTACLQPISIANDDGTAPTALPSLTLAQRIWEKCCISYSVLPAKTIKKTSFKTLDESPNNVPTAEERSLFATAGASDCIQIFVAENFQQAGVVGKQISGGGGTYEAGGANPKVVVVEGAVPAVVAHEIGHASGFRGHDANITVMKETGAFNVPNSSAVSAAVCAAARTGAVLSGTSGKDDCCMFLA